MPLLILFIGIVLVAAGINNKIPDLMQLLKEDFRPSDNSPGFHVWVLAIVGLGALGYVKPLKGLANGFLVLVILGLILSNGGFFTQFTAALKGNDNG
jgi:hypothetical protein